MDRPPFAGGDAKGQIQHLQAEGQLSHSDLLKIPFRDGLGQSIAEVPNHCVPPSTNGHTS